MALADPTGGAGRATLADALSKLTKQYAGTGAGYTDTSGAQVLSDQQLRDWLAAHPDQMPSQAPGAVLGADPALAFANVPAALGARPNDTGGPGWGDGYGTQGWGANGVNLFNPNLARGDMAAPGPGWRLDTFGTPFWRHDYILTPQGPKIKGEDGYAGDYPLMTPEQLAQYGIQ